jgi:simple sugar transport system ATP-binding protein/ribose transport system ATP-binding protein
VTSEETEASLVTGMLGRPASRAYPEKRLAPADAPVVLDVAGLTAPGVTDATLTLRAGEIVGLAGLIGAGRSELARAIYGANPVTAGAVTSGGAALGGRPAASIAAGVALIPESRKDDGLILRRPIRENVSLTSLGRFQRFGFVRRGAERAQVRDALDRVDGSQLLESSAGSLSGGNQQKLLFARALLIGPDVLLADEPTRGIDVGAKRDIYDVLVRLAAEGMAILLISNEVEEILGLAHRVLVMRAGRLVAELSGPDMTEEGIVSAAFGTTATSAA